MTKMRRKTIVRKAEIRTSPQPSDPDGINGGSGFEGDEKGDSGREKSSTLGETETDNSADLFKYGVCFVCKGEDNQVLGCEETECPVCIHHSCMPDEPDFDDLGNFYCPYCWYKRLIAKYVRLQEKVMTAEKCLKNPKETSVRVDTVMVETNVGARGKASEVNVSLGRMNDLNPCESKRVNGELGRQCQELEKTQKNNVVAADILEPEVPTRVDMAVMVDTDLRKTGNAIEECISVGKMMNLSPSKNRGEEEKEEDRRLGNGCVELEKNQQNKVVEGEPEVSKDEEREKGQDSDVGGGMRKRGRSGGELELEIEQSMSSPIPTNSDDEHNISNQDFVLVMPPKGNGRAKPIEAPIEARPCRYSYVPSSLKKPLFQGKTATECDGPKQSCKKRKRLFWTKEEEEMLRVGVEEFSQTTNKNIPWRKILEFGRNVFKEDRMPEDLREKWKKIKKNATRPEG